MNEIITGAACADITGVLYSRIMKKIEDRETATVIVPDQFVFETEKSLYHMCRDSGRTDLFKNIRVCTIARISDEIIKTFVKDKPPADDITKNVIMYRAIHDRQVPLGALSRISKKSGFTSQMVKTVSLFKTAGISPDMLEDSISGERFEKVPSLFRKLEDISRLYLEYDQMLGDKYTDKLDVTMRAAKIAATDISDGQSYFSDKCVFVTGFNSFSGSQLEMMKVIAEKAMYSCFAFVYDKDNPRDIFKTIRADIAAIAGRNAESTTIIVPENYKTAFGIRQISRFIYNDNQVNTDTNAEMSGVKLIRADDIYSEMEYIAAEIRRLVNDEGLRYRDIAVLCSDPAEYRTPAESAFSKYDIPMFCDIPEAILNAPLTNLILILLKALDEPTEQNILSYVRSSFLRIKDNETKKFRRLSYREIDCFDGYIYRWQLNGEHFSEPFVTQNMGKNEQRQAMVAEKVRLAAVEPLLKLRSRLTDSANKEIHTGGWISREICEFLYTEVGIESSVRSADDNATTLWDILVRIFEAIYNALEDVQISVKQYYSLFRDICAQTTLALPPQLSDCVLLGDTGRTRAEGIKAAFIAGANYGKFPDESADFGLFSEYEAELLNENELKIVLKQEDKYHFSRYQAYRAMALPSKQLYISYPMMNTACQSLSPSETVNELLNLFPSLSVDYAGDTEKYGDKFYCSTKKALRSRYAALFGANDVERVGVLEKALKLSGDGAYTEYLRQLVESRPKAYQHKISGKTADYLFWKKTISATKLEKLCQCRFEFFCKEGLKIKERRTINASNTDVGIAVHHVLENVLREYSDKMSEFFLLDRDKLNELSKKYLDDYREQKLGGSSYRSNSFNYMYEELTSRCADMLTLLQTEFSCRKYRPVMFELDFSKGQSVALPQLEQITSGAPKKTGELEPPTIQKLNHNTLNIKPLELEISPNNIVKIIGIVDRADMFSSEQQTDGTNTTPSRDYLRIVDYKTGGHAFKLSNALYGVNVQMLIYLIALDDANKSSGINTIFMPAGVSYLPAKATEAGSKQNEGLLSLIASGHYPSGMCVVDKNTSAELQQFMKSYVKAITNFDRQEYAKNSLPADNMPVGDNTATATAPAAPEKTADTADNTSAVKSGSPEKTMVECTVKEKNLLPQPDAIPSPEQYQKLHDAIRDLAVGVLGKLYAGDIQALPVIYDEEGKSGKQSECTNCHYKGICGNQNKFGVVVNENITEEKLGVMNNTDQTNLMSTSSKSSSKSTKSAEKPKKTKKAAADSENTANSSAEKPKRGRKAATKSDITSPMNDEKSGGDNQ